VRAANLARRPFRNERLRNVLFALAAVAILGISVKHAFVVRRLLPGRTSALHAEVAGLEAEAARLRAEQASLRGVTPDPRAVARWTVVKDLVDRRAFSWTGLFTRLEERLPTGARLVSITPTVQKGEIVIEVQAMVRSPEVGWQFMRALEEGGDFNSVFPLNEGENGEFRYTMRYRPRAAAPAAAPTAAVPSGTTAAGPGEAVARPATPTATGGAAARRPTPEAVP
jgi:Tfp pilus assembly protein PilN